MGQRHAARRCFDLAAQLQRHVGHGARVLQVRLLQSLDEMRDRPLFRKVGESGHQAGKPGDCERDAIVATDERVDLHAHADLEGLHLLVFDDVADAYRVEHQPGLAFDQHRLIAGHQL